MKGAEKTYVCNGESNEGGLVLLSIFTFSCQATLYIYILPTDF